MHFNISRFEEKFILYIPQETSWFTGGPYTKEEVENKGYDLSSHEGE
jgi:hypothetical protein